MRCVESCVASCWSRSRPSVRTAPVPAGRPRTLLSAVVGFFPEKEGHLGLHIRPPTGPWFRKATARPTLVEDERFKDARSRLQNNDELEAIVFEWASRQDPRAAYQTAGAARAPIAFVHTIRDLFESEQLRSRDFFQRLEHPVSGEITLPGPPFRMSEVQSRLGRVP